MQSESRVTPTADNEPLFFLPARTYRCYTGGALLDAFLNRESPQDGHHPEAWIASTTRACNGPGHPPTEGLSSIRRADGTPGPLFADILSDRAGELLGPGERDRTALPVLCKFLDSAIRLPVQCHPDKEFARAHYDSEFGKSECWIVLGTRPIDGVEPHLLLGFKPGITREAFADMVRRQDASAMASALHRVAVEPGDAWYIPGRFPHAIGPGVFMLEVQEPSDWVVQPECLCGDTPLDDTMRFGPLSEDLALDCFSYEGEPLDSIRARLCMAAREERREDGGVLERLADDRYGDCFTVRRLAVTGEFGLPASEWQLGIVTCGAGSLFVAGTAYTLQPGDAFLIPHATPWTVSAADAASALGLYLVHA